MNFSNTRVRRRCIAFDAHGQFSGVLRFGLDEMQQFSIPRKLGRSRKNNSLPVTFFSSRHTRGADIRPPRSGPACCSASPGQRPDVAARLLPVCGLLFILTTGDFAMYVGKGGRRLEQRSAGLGFRPLGGMERRQGQTQPMGRIARDADTDSADATAAAALAALVVNRGPAQADRSILFQPPLESRTSLAGFLILQLVITELNYH